MATCRTPTDLGDLEKSTPSSQLLVVKCDVTSEQDIQNAFKSGIEKFGRIDIVFNNAGYGILAEVESTPEAAARQLFDVNFWGASAVSREAVRVFRDLNPPGLGGRLYNMSSGGGLVGLPASGYYSARCVPVIFVHGDPVLTTFSVNSVGFSWKMTMNVN